MSKNPNTGSVTPASKEPTPKYAPDARKARDDAIAEQIAIGGEPVAPYDAKKHLHRGKGDVSGWPNAAVAMDPEAHQRLADKAVSDAASDYAEKRGPRK